MKNIILFFAILGLILHSHAQNSKPKSKVKRVVIEYKGKNVNARQLTVSSEIPMDLDSAWENVKTPVLLEFVAKGMIRFKALESELPKQWELGQTYGVKMRVFGFIPFGGIHYLWIEKVDEENYKIATQEWDKQAKVWNHKIVLRDLDNGKIYYEDSITIYGGAMTGFITSFAKRFYIHRQKRWQIVAKEKLNFSE
jgi:hypothetical protein